MGLFLGGGGVEWRVSGSVHQGNPGEGRGWVGGEEEDKDESFFYSEPKCKINFLSHTQAWSEIDMKEVLVGNQLEVNDEPSEPLGKTGPFGQQIKTRVSGTALIFPATSSFSCQSLSLHLSKLQRFFSSSENLLGCNISLRYWMMCDEAFGVIRQHLGVKGFFFSPAGSGCRSWKRILAPCAPVLICITAVQCHLLHGRHKVPEGKEKRNKKTPETGNIDGTGCCQTHEPKPRPLGEIFKKYT